MADETVKVQYIIDEKDYVNGLKTIQKESDKTSKEITQDNEKSSKSWKELGLNAKVNIGIAVLAIKGIINKVKEATDKAADYTRQMRGLNEVSRAFGQDGGTAQKVAQELEKMSGGMVSASKAAQGLKFLISSGYSIDQASEMSKAMLNIGAFNNVVGDLGQAFVDSAKGIKTGSIELIENIGLTERMPSVMKRAGVDIKDGIDITNNREQAQALFNSVMKQGEIFAGNLDEAVKGYDKTMAETSLNIDKLTRRIGTALQPVLIAAANALNKIIKPFIEEVPTATQKLEPLITEMANLQSKSELTAKEQERLQTVMNDISLISPKMVSDYDAQGNAIINLANATDELVKLKEAELRAERVRLELEQIEKSAAFEKGERKLEGLRNKRDDKIKAQEEIKARHQETLQKYIDAGVQESYIEGQRQAIESAENNIAVIKSEFAEKNRVLILEQEGLQANNDLRREQINLINSSLERLRAASGTGLQGYQSAITGLDETSEAEKNARRTAGQFQGRSEDIAGNLLPEQSPQVIYTKSLNEIMIEEMRAAADEEYQLRLKAIEDEKYLDDMQRQERIQAAEKWKEDKDKELQDRFNITKSSNEQLNFLEETRLSAKKGFINAENQLVNNLVEGQKVSLANYANIIAKQVEMTLTQIGIEAGVKSLWEAAQALASYALKKPVTGYMHTQAAIGFAGVAAAAGLGATAAHSVGSATTTDTAETPTSEDAKSVAISTAENQPKQLIINESDHQKMRGTLVESLNTALDEGYSLKKVRQ